MGSDAAFAERALKRIYGIMLALGVAGAGAGLWLRGSAWALGFAAGAAAAALNFRWLHQLAYAAGEGGRRPGRGLVFFLSIRYLLFGAAAYVIVKFFEVSLVAVLAGLLVAAAAVVVEILYELIYART